VEPAKAFESRENQVRRYFPCHICIYHAEQPKKCDSLVKSSKSSPNSDANCRNIVNYIFSNNIIIIHNYSDSMNISFICIYTLVNSSIYQPRSQREFFFEFKCTRHDYNITIWQWLWIIIMILIHFFKTKLRLQHLWSLSRVIY